MSKIRISEEFTTSSTDFIRVATLEELKTAGMIVVRGARCPLLVVYDDGKVFALDNRCPHLGFPLHRGSVEDGILTCHWHHARFDLASGCTFDLWADDVPTAAVELRDGVVWVCPQTRYTDGDAHWRNRLREGLEQNIGLVLAKAVLGLIGEGVDYRALVRDAVLFGARNRDGWGIGLTILTALAKLIPSLPEEETYLALYKGISRVARDCDGAAPRRDRLPLAPRQFQPLPVLERWFRHWTRVRHRDAAERTLLTAIASGASSIELAALMLTAVTDRYFADGGHALDFTNKAFESLDLIGWEHASAILPSLVDQMVSARGSEESNAWRQHPTMKHLPSITLLLTFLSTPAYAGQVQATWYGNELRGHRTASGEMFNPSGMTAAHRSLPFGTCLVIGNPRTGRKVVVRVNEVQEPAAAGMAHQENLGRLPGLKFMRTLWVCDVSGGPFQFTATKPGATRLGLEEARRELRISPAEFDEVAAELGRTLDFFKVPKR